MSNLKLVVEVVSAHNLLPKDGQGSSSSYVELHFDNQRFRTTIKEKDLDPAWNETFYFNISNPNNLSDLTLDAYVYNNVQANHSKSCQLGKRKMVRLSCTNRRGYETEEGRRIKILGIVLFASVFILCAWQDCCEEGDR